MTLLHLLESLTEDEREFIAQQNYGTEVARHREELDLVIQNGGMIDREKQYWYPYEVIEL